MIVSVIEENVSEPRACGYAIDIRQHLVGLASYRAARRHGRECAIEDENIAKPETHVAEADMGAVG